MTYSLHLQLDIMPFFPDVVILSNSIINRLKERFATDVSSKYQFFSEYLIVSRLFPTRQQSIVDYLPFAKHLGSK